MSVKKRNDEDRYGFLDRLQVSKINMALYVFILVIAVIILYFVVLEYLIHTGQRPSLPLQVNITKNAVESLGGEFHPVVVVDVATRKDSVITVRLESSSPEIYQSSGEPVNNYTAFFILPADNFSTEFNLSVTAMDNNRRVLTYNSEFKTHEKPGVMFKIQ